MTRTIPGAIATALTVRQVTLARCMILDLRDGTQLGLTTHDRNLLVNLGTGDVVCRADVGALPSAVGLSLGLEADNFEITGPLGSVVTRPAVLGGRYNRARALLADVNWQAPSQFVRLMSGKVAEGRVQGGAFTLQIRSQTDAYNQTIGRVLSPYCSHDFGVFNPPVSRCQAIPQSWAGTVVAVTDDLQFQVTWGSPAPTSAEARNGLVTFTSGALTGTLPVEVFDLTGSPPDALELYQPLVEAPQIGDLLTVEEGCDKLHATCKTKGQILNFGGFPFMPGTDAYVKFPNPGSTTP